MTTIRVTRRHPNPPVPVDGAPASSLPEDARTDTVRLALVDPPAPRTTLDGAWWPRTQDLSQELPALVEELHRRGIRVTRVGYHPAAWKPTDRRLEADGRTIRLGWFRGLDPHLLNLTGDLERRRVDLLVVPPDTAAADAEHAFAAASDRVNRRTPTALLDTLGLPVEALTRLATERRTVPKTLRMSGTDLVWELEESVDLAGRTADIVTARASNQVVTLMARLPGQEEFAHLTVAPGQLAWWSLGEESDVSPVHGGG